uniref:CX domain-containing protein n=1 Tax=Romanomermis culicivorax TaxID=13658 RepID=A0A915L5G4_ROMCU
MAFQQGHLLEVSLILSISSLVDNNQDSFDEQWEKLNREMAQRFREHRERINARKNRVGLGGYSITGSTVNTDLSLRRGGTSTWSTASSSSIKEMLNRATVIPPRPAIRHGDGGYIYDVRKKHTFFHGTMRSSYVNHNGYHDGYPGPLTDGSIPIAKFVHKPIIKSPFVYYPDYGRHYFYGYSNYDEHFYDAVGDDKLASDAPWVCRYEIAHNDTHFKNMAFENGTKVAEIVYECDAGSEYCCNGLDCCVRDAGAWLWWQIL